MQPFRIRRRLGRAGNILLLTALAAVPLIGMVALAVDFGQASLVKQKLDLAADSAALLGATAASNAWKAGQTDAVQVGIAAGQGRFMAQSASQTHVVTNPPAVVVTQNGGLFNASVTYTAATPTTFGRILGITVLPIGGESNASLSLNPFADIQILMDVSSSMTLAATPEAVAAMEALAAHFKAPKGEPVPGNVSTTCTFACHWTATGVDYYTLAVKQGIQLRITVLQAAVANLINTLTGLDANNYYQLGLYTFNQGFNPIYPLSQDVAGASASLTTIAPRVNFCADDVTCPDTYFSNAMAQLTAIDASLPQQQGAQAAQRFLFLVSDGVYDQYINGQRQLGAFNPADCAALKTQGVSILVLYTPYTPIPSNSYYMQHVDPEASQIVPNLQACASSPSYYFVANDAADINTQLQAMLQLVIQATSHLIKGPDTAKPAPKPH
ncbi:TadE/TadG family type IV pilus assembly protein [Rhodopila sp.]|uniref:TadE/TadG family type IV pilus assembly protein n=1 Tax=Rhodopila sp. TaxID=2480087 RepID=UPI003D0D13CA